MAEAVSAADRVRWLLRSWHDVLEGGWDSRSDGDGCLLTPSDWSRASYPEAERQLASMRANGSRRAAWHAVARYRDAERVAIRVRVHRTKRGGVAQLPPNCELVGGGVTSGEKIATVIVARWSPAVRLELAEAGIEQLVRLMYGGRRDRIVLPRAVYVVAFGG